MIKRKARKGYKICSCCGRELKATLHNFHSDTAKRDGLNNNCKACQNYFVVENYEKNKDYYSAYNSIKHLYNTERMSFKTLKTSIKNLKANYAIGRNANSIA